MATESKIEFKDLYPLSLKRIREDQENDEELQKGVLGAITKKQCYQ